MPTLLLSDIVSQKIPPRLVTAQKALITGPVGVGKTTIAKALAARRMGVEQWLRDVPATTRSCRLCQGEPLALDPPGATHHTCYPGEEADKYALRDIADAFPFDFYHINGGDDGIDKIRELAAASLQQPTDPRCRCRAFIIDEVHALPDKAVQALLLPLERDVVNLWVACTSRPAGSLDAALRSRFAVKLDLGGADVEAVGRSLGWTDYEARARASGGDLRLALAGESSESAVETQVIRIAGGKPLLCFDSRALLAQSIRNPAALQVRILDALVDHKDAHTAMCVQLSQRNDVAAHQLLAAARRAGLLQ
jgi:hypothetical protein